MVPLNGTLFCPCRLDNDFLEVRSPTTAKGCIIQELTPDPVFREIRLEHWHSW